MAVIIMNRGMCPKSRMLEMSRDRVLLKSLKSRNKAATIHAMRRKKAGLDGNLGMAKDLMKLTCHGK
jgi:hypothetical protein